MLIVAQCDTVVTAEQREMTPSGTFCEERDCLEWAKLPNAFQSKQQNTRSQPSPDHDEGKLQAGQQPALHYTLVTGRATERAACYNRMLLSSA